MRIAFFDGILENHVPESLQRSLARRGHQVLNRGKFGHGFKFPRPGDDVSRIHQEIDEVLAFNPDVVLVFRPALLPPELILRLRRRDITLVAWFSDDPVLFDLSYGPVVEHYDVILHCGNESVLAYYEDFFGKPTGVNFPFWTDHHSFPRLWEPRSFMSDAVFIGNVQDEVRRQRYFDLSRMRHSIRIHGNVGTDYFGVWGGFLDTDMEVAQSIARSKVALNIPQFFQDHHGLETWFPDLDHLGFFEYPSRVIQYMAVGIPAITLLPFDHNFVSYPEMLVFQHIEEVDEYLHRVTPEELQDLSHRISSRFSNHFSADSRALAFESVLEDDSWRGLNVGERARWFLNYVPDHSLEPPEGTNHKPVFLQERSNTKTIAEQRTPTKLKIACVNLGLYEEVSVAGIVQRALGNLGHQVELYEGTLGDGTIIEDPSHLFESVPSIQLIESLTEFDCVFFLGDEMSLTEYSSNRLSANGVISYKVSTAPDSSTAKRQREVERFDVVLYTKAETHESSVGRGARNTFYLPPLPDNTFLALLGNDYERETLRITSTTQLDESLAPAFLTDIKKPARTMTPSSIGKLSLEEAAKTLSASVTFMSLSGTRNSVAFGELFPFVVAAANLTVVPRSTNPQTFWRWKDAIIQVRDVGELLAKSRLVNNSSDLLADKIRVRKLVLESHSAENHLESILMDTSASSDNCTSFDAQDGSRYYLIAGEPIELADMFASPGPKIIDFTVADPYHPLDLKTIKVYGPTFAPFEVEPRHSFRLYIHDPTDLKLVVLEEAKRNAAQRSRLPVASIRAHEVNDKTLANSLKAKNVRVGVFRA